MDYRKLHRIVGQPSHDGLDRSDEILAQPWGASFIPLHRVQQFSPGILAEGYPPARRRRCRISCRRSCHATGGRPSASMIARRRSSSACWAGVTARSASSRLSHNWPIRASRSDGDRRSTREFRMMTLPTDERVWRWGRPRSREQGVTPARQMRYINRPGSAHLRNGKRCHVLIARSPAESRVRSMSDRWRWAVMRRFRCRP